MNKSICILPLLLFFIGAKAQTNLNQGLILNVPFDGSYTDISSNNLTVSPFNGPVFTTDKFGNPGSALQLDGINDYVEISSPNGELSPRNKMSFFLRFKTQNANLQTILGKVNHTNAKDKEYQVAINWSTYPGALFGIANTNQTECNQSTPTFNRYSNTGQNTITIGSWHCLAGTYDGTMLKIYLDGVLTDTQNTTGMIDSCSNPSLWIGKWWINDLQTFSGAIDELRMYNRAINIQEIEALCEFYEFPESTMDYFDDKNVTISANPTVSGILTLEFSKTINSKTNISLIDMRGKVLKSWNLNSMSRKELDITEYSQGVYTISIVSENFNISKRIIKN